MSTAIDAVESYRLNRSIYQALCVSVEGIVRNVLAARKLEILSVTSRAKTIESFEEKLRRKRYEAPAREMVDLAGIRVVAFIERDVRIASEILKELFDVIGEHSGDKADELGAERVGYRSVHLVCTLGAGRTGLPEYSRFSDMVFEIQIRTALQHAWAEVEHDRSYKFKGSLPAGMRRRFNLIAGLLELADR